MRISTFLLGACVFCSYAENSHSQNARVSINKNNTQLEKILNEIESQTDYLFIYNNQVNVSRKVSVKAKTKPVSEVLDNLFRNAGIEYEMEGTHIILSAKGQDAIASAQQQAHTLTGRIVDNNGEAIIGANVVVKGTTNGTVTDLSRLILNRFCIFLISVTCQRRSLSVTRKQSMSYYWKIRKRWTKLS